MSDPVISKCRLYNFPPFFTIQPNLASRKSQLDEWSTLIKDYCESRRLFKIDIEKALKEPPFQNPSISRGLTTESLLTIFEDMQAKGFAEWENKNKSSIFIYWNTPDEWANLIYRWARNAGYINEICTFFDIVSDEKTVDEPFHGIDFEILKKSLQILEKQGKATILSLDTNGGVKFLQ